MFGIEFDEATSLGRDVVRVAKAQQLTFVAAGVAFYAFMSLVPLAVLGLAIATVTAGPGDLAESVTDAASGILTPTAQQLLVEAVFAEEGRSGATVIGFVALLWSGSRVLRGLDSAFSRIYGTVEAKTIVGSLRDSAVVTVAILLGLVAVAGIESVLAAATREVGIISFVGPLFLVATLLAAFLPLYVVFPDADVEAAEALPGAALAAVGWTLLGRTFTVYAGLASTYALYGALGAVLLVLTWLYVGSLLLVLGAVVNAVLAGRADRTGPGDRERPRGGETDRQLQIPGARGVDTEAMSDDATGADEGPTDRSHRGADARTTDRSSDPEVLREEIERLRDDLESVESNVERRTVRKDSLERDLKRYVRRRVRRGHARGWGPYLVLLYGTAMTIGAFYFLAGAWAVLAMFVVWTSTLGVYVLMVLFGAGVSLLGIPGRVRDRVDEWRS